MVIGSRIFIFALIMVVTSRIGYAVEYTCNNGDSACLIKAIVDANANGEANTIRLGAGTYPLTTPFAPNVGLPPVTSTLKIQGADATTTLIDGEEKVGRIINVEVNGNLTLDKLTLQGGGFGGGNQLGAGIQNSGILAITDSVIKQNRSVGVSCAGINNRGTLTIIRSTLTENNSQGETGGAMCTTGEALIADSSIVRNASSQGG